MRSTMLISYEGNNVVKICDICNSVVKIFESCNKGVIFQLKLNCRNVIFVGIIQGLQFFNALKQLFFYCTDVQDLYVCKISGKNLMIRK